MAGAAGGGERVLDEDGEMALTDVDAVGRDNASNLSGELHPEEAGPDHGAVEEAVLTSVDALGTGVGSNLSGEPHLGHTSSGGPDEQREPVALELTGSGIDDTGKGAVDWPEEACWPSGGLDGDQCRYGEVDRFDGPISFTFDEADDSAQFGAFTGFHFEVEAVTVPGSVGRGGRGGGNDGGSGASAVPWFAVVGAFPAFCFFLLRLADLVVAVDEFDGLGVVDVAPVAREADHLPSTTIVFFAMFADKALGPLGGGFSAFTKLGVDGRIPRGFCKGSEFTDLLKCLGPVGMGLLCRVVLLEDATALTRGDGGAGEGLSVVGPALGNAVG
ncbi:hypothetical protein CC1G_13986 [Coprinopsis cinerea okayama7|uniref:Uncharacterized protein n=1 Tax=Coprinopsis cinerea (strain Okayama-7 / 130 / ATCC MYA-4618 / FGSC 9003) TaxID=240176 RepID=D6RKZ3_COPC7|nr:hypothetical protein CC1G_13986 [Coprinopsis cinerea okayama7\|eukprot:XP_002911947.1 hypothetical protein CC1G_13986 [Coprinopsis cinerea okayama7\